MRTSTYLMTCVLGLAFQSAAWAQDPQTDSSTAPGKQPATQNPPVDVAAQPTLDRRAEHEANVKDDLGQIVAAWPERPRLGAKLLIAKYGRPQVISAEKLVWKKQGPFKRISVSRTEDQHDFPKPHTDFVEHTIAYQISPEKADELTAFDSSVTFDRTKGELSARCDSERHNILALNLAHEILAGRLDVEEGRQTMGQLVMQDLLGKEPLNVVSLQFEPAPEPAGFADEPIIAGIGKRMPQNEADLPQGGERQIGDAEVLGTLLALHENGITAATVASEKQMSPPLQEFVKKLHTELGKYFEKAVLLGQKIELSPIETPEIDRLRAKAAGELAGIVEFGGNDFGDAFLNATVKGHTDAVATIENQLLKNAEDAQLKEHLIATRDQLNAHLEHARRLQSGQQIDASSASVPPTPAEPPRAETRPSDATISSPKPEPRRDQAEPAVTSPD